MLAQARDLASGSFVPSNPSTVGCPTPAGLPHLWRVSSSGGGLFKRPAILWIRGAFYLREVSQRAPVSISRRLHWLTKNYLPGSSENIGISSLFPDDKLR